jgi:hypothetical protein
MKETEMIHISRKTAVTSFFVLCALMIAAAPAFAQGVAFQASSLPQQARVEGLTETMGAVVIQATGGGTVKAGSSITVVYSGAITNLSSGSTNNGVLACNPTASCTNLSVPAVSSGTNQLTVQFNADVAFAQGDYIVISQVRVNVNALGSGTSTVTATMSGTSSQPTTNPITFTQATVVVASVVSPSNSVAVTAAPVAQTCSVPKPNGVVGSSGFGTFQVTVTEKYPAALTNLTNESSFTPAFPPSNGTKLTYTFTGVPSGLAIQALQTTASAGSLTLSDLTTPGSLITSNGSPVVFTFTVAGGSTAQAENLGVIFQIGVPSNSSSFAAAGTPIPSLGATATVTAAVNLAPASGTVSFASTSLGGGTVATFGDCVTNLLFPYVTNQGGYDTSFSIANTTSDDLAFGAGAAASPQTGSCTLNFWPTTDTSVGTTGTATQFTTPTVDAGKVYAFSLSGTSFSGQTGYMIAVCRFLNAHGFAFLTNGFAQAGGPQLSHGYLGLVLPNPITSRSTSGASEALGN